MEQGAVGGRKGLSLVNAPGWAKGAEGGVLWNVRSGQKETGPGGGR
jgi:hypothetical protein